MLLPVPSKNRKISSVGEKIRVENVIFYGNAVDYVSVREDISIPHGYIVPW